MANEEFIFRLGADISQFTQSITQVEAELRRVRGTLRNQTGQAIVETNRYIQQLEGSLVNLRNAGLAPLNRASANGTMALNSLSQVARDAPFGFIAIQNNLPIVLDQFTALAKQSGGLGSALKAVGASLIGPAGLSFAFGAIIAGTTALIQKYGSLGEAFNQILGITPKITDAQKAYNKSVIDTTANVSEENAKVNILLKTLNNSTKPQSDRLAAYQALKQISPDITKGIADENALTERSIQLINQQAQARKALLQLKITEAGITAALQSNEEKLATLNFKKATAQQKIDVIQKKLNDGLSNQNVLARTAEQGINTYAITLKSAKNELAAFDTEIKTLITEQNSYLSQLDPIINGIANLEYGFIKSETALKNQQKALKDAAKETGIWTGFAASATFAGDDFNQIVQANAKNLEGWRYIIQKVAENTMAAQTAMDGLGNTLNTKVNAGFQNLNDTLMQNDMLLGLESFQRRINAVFKKIDENTKNTKKELKQNFSNVANIIESALIQPLTYLFNTVLEGGKISWKEFGNIVIEQLKRILVQIIATTAAAAIANLIVPGAGTAAVNLANMGAQTGGTGIFGSRQSAVNFGGVNPGGLAMSGSVALSLKGSDLIGAINRTNTNINRIG